MSASGYARIVRYRINKALKGICISGGCHEIAKGLCEKHRVKQSAYAKEWYKRKKNVV